MTTTIFTCDGCKTEFTPQQYTPIKRGEVFNKVSVTAYPVKHPKDVDPLDLYFTQAQLLLCPRCEDIIKAVCNIP